MLPIVPLSEVLLAPGGVQCLVVNFATLSRSDALRLRGLLSASERARYASIVLEGERQAQSMTRASLRLVLGRLLGIAPDALAIAVSAHGKPFCCDAQDLRFSVSHSGSFGLLAFSRGAEVGCDTEVKQMVGDIDGMEVLVLHPVERQALAALSKPDRHAAFLRYWVRKEAVLKATGLGFSADPTSIRVTQNQCTVAITASDGRPLEHTFTLHDSPLASEYHAAVASPQGSCHWARLQL